MKVIISHDIDHITVWEHLFDLIIPKFYLRNTIELFNGSIKIREYFLRFENIIENKWQNINEIIIFDKENNIPATFFIGVNNGKGLNYSLNKSKKWIKKIIESGFDIGVHGIKYSDIHGITEEYQNFQKISGLDSFGIRMHYLRTNYTTINNLSNAGYLFDSTVYEKISPYKVNNMWEFPLHIMDGYFIYQGKKYENITFDQIIEYTKIEINKIIDMNIPYLTILFHDRYFCSSFSTWEKWYVWLIDYLIKNKFEFISYKNAIDELQDQSSL
ncbi:MAG: hypothetical protein ABR968_08460 [Bacteroidales bacterium]|jgi:peptidoglycan/xylan/chitin deacetylase (PgdA/CDA1 family)